MARRDRTRKQVQQPAARRAVAPTPGRDVSVDPRTAACAAAIFLIVFALYALTAARDLVIGDSSEFLTAAATLGVPHPPGYPLLIILGHLFSLLPVGPLPFRMDLLSAVSGAAAAAFTFLIARQFGAGAIASAIAALTLASHPLFWEWSLVIEAFPLNNLMVAAVLYFLFRWEGGTARRGLVLAALLTGLGASNHQTIVFIMPAILIVLWRHRARVLGDRPLVVMCLGATAAGFLPYAILPWAASRHPYLNLGGISSFGDLAAHFLRQAYGTGNLSANGDAAGSAWPRLLLLARSFTWIQWVLIPLGVIELHRRHRWYFWSTLVVFAIAGPSFAAYANLNVETSVPQWVLRRFFLMPHVVLAPLAAFGVVRLTDLVSGLVLRGRPRQAEAAVAVSAAAAILAGVIITYPRVDQRLNHVALRYGEDILNSLPPRAVLFTWGDDVVMPITYLQAVEHRRPDVTLVMTGILKGGSAWYIPQLKLRDPALVVPFTQYDPDRPSANMKALVAANPGRPFVVAGDQFDDSLKDGYWYYRRGLVRDVLPLSADVSIEAASAEYDRLMRLYRVPDPKTLKSWTFELRILKNYATAAKSIGDEYATARRNAEASTWYQRALGIYPGWIEAQDALRRVSGK